MNIHTECRSSEEMKATFEEYNRLEKETREKCCIISMDVRALYPSMEWKEIVNAVREMIENSEKEVENVDWTELGKYLAVTMSDEQIEKEGLRKVIPQRKDETKRKIGVAYLLDKKNDEKWTKCRPPGHKQRKKMIGIAVSEGVEVCMSNHTYCVGDKVYLQTAGGPIGLELTGAVSRPFMAKWDRLYLEKAKKAGVEMKLYERYVDDSNQVGIAPPSGAKYDKATEKIVIDPELQDEEQPPDERLAKLLLDIANSVMKCIQMEADWPSKNPDKCMPILDMKVWTNKEGSIVYRHYEKPVSRKTVLHSKSAHPATCKRSVHTQEVLRRMLNCSKKVNWKKDTAPIVSEYMKRMCKAGYNENYRKAILTQALAIYDRKWEEEEKGIRPVYRPKDYKKEERKREKEEKRHDWAKSGNCIAPIFVPASPESTLLKMMREEAKKLEEEGIKFKIVEMGGSTMKRELQRSNPTATPGCKKEDCECCKRERGKGGPCHTNNVNYIVECRKCQESERSVYIGETARNLYTRMKEHIQNKTESSFMKRHINEVHQGEEVDFEARVTKTNKDCLSRQVREGIHIQNYGSKYNIMNTKSEWNQPSVYRIQNEIVRN